MAAGGRDGGKGQRVWDQYVHTVLFKMDNQQGPTVKHRELCSRLRGSLDGRGVWSGYCAVLSLVTQSCLTLGDPMDCTLPGSSVHGDSPGKNTGVDSLFLLQGIFPNQGSNPDLPRCRQILYLLSHQRSPVILEWVAYPFSRGTSQPRN